MDHQEFTVYKKLFNLMGFEDLLKYKTIHLIQFAIMTFHIIIMAFFYNDIIFINDPIGTCTDLLKVIATFLSSYMGLYVSWKFKYVRPIIKQKFDGMDDIKRTFYVNSEKVLRKFQKNYKIKFIFLLGFISFRWMIELMKFQEEPKTFYFICAILYEMAYNFLKQMHSIFYIDYINHYFTILIKEIEHFKELTDCNEKLKNTKYEKFLEKRLRMSHEYFQILCDAKKLVNKRSGPFLLFMQINLFVHNSAILYWTIFRFYNQKEDINIFLIYNCCSLIVALFLFAFALTDSCDQCETNGKLLAHAIHSIKIHREVENDEISHAIEDFILDIMSNNFEYSAGGTFVINYKWFGGVSRLM
jgi:hypothetical protein